MRLSSLPTVRKLVPVPLLVGVVVTLALFIFLNVGQADPPNDALPTSTEAPTTTTTQVDRCEAARDRLNKLELIMRSYFDYAEEVWLRGDIEEMQDVYTNLYDSIVSAEDAADYASDVCPSDWDRLQRIQGELTATRLGLVEACFADFPSRDFGCVLGRG